MCWAFPQGEGPKVPSTMFKRNLFLNPVIRITTVIMVFVDIKIASIVTGGREAPKAEGLFIEIVLRYHVYGGQWIFNLGLLCTIEKGAIYKCYSCYRDYTIHLLCNYNFY